MVTILLIAALLVLAGLGMLIFIGTRSGRSDLVAPPAEFGPEANQRPELPRIEPETVELPPEEERPELAPPPPLPPVEERPELAPAASPFEELSQEHGADQAPEPVPKGGTRSQIDNAPADAETLWQEEPKPAGTPPGKTEGDYSKEELVEREVRAMLLQNRRDRAIKYVRSELKMNSAVAQAYIEMIESKIG